jgi:hypothetical protein
MDFPPSNTAMPQTSSNDLAAIADLELSNELQKPAPVAPFSHIGTAKLQELRQLSEIFLAALPPTTTQHAPTMSQSSSRFRNTVHPVPVPMLGSLYQAPSALATPSHSPRLVWYPSERMSPRQAQYPRVAPRVNPVNVAYPRVNHTLPLHSVIPLTPHPSAANAPYVPQCMTGVNLFDKFEEEHMEASTLPRHTTRARARQHSANNAQHHSPRVFRPIIFTNTQVFHAAPKQAINQIPMANDVIKENTGASLEYRQLIQDKTTFPV